MIRAAGSIQLPVPMTGAARPQQWLADDLGDAIFRVEVAV